jgi:hypothetical protein
MTMDFQDTVDITIDAMQDYSQEIYAASWLVNLEKIIYFAIVQNNRNVLNYFKPYQVAAMRELIDKRYWVVFDTDISFPVVKPLDYIFADNTPIKNGAD